MLHFTSQESPFRLAKSLCQCVHLVYYAAQKWRKWRTYALTLPLQKSSSSAHLLTGINVSRAVPFNMPRKRLTMEPVARKGHLIFTTLYPTSHGRRCPRLERNSHS